MTMHALSTAASSPFLTTRAMSTGVIGGWTILFVLVHVPLAMVMVREPFVATAHAYAVLALGLFWVLEGRLQLVAALAGYITGAEILWRAASADIFWEFGKYSTILLLGLGVLTSGRFHRASKVPFVYFLLLVPSIYVMPEFVPGEISFNLSGPLALTVASAFFSTLTLTREQFHRIMSAVLMPVVGLVAIAAYSTLTAADLEFTSGSNFIASGGIGPNQVSSVLGLGAFAASVLLCAANVQRTRVFFQVFLYGVVGVLLVQCLLTFSRGGAFTAIAAIIVTGTWLVHGSRKRVSFAVAAAAFTALFTLAVLPTLDDFTEGALARRYADSSTTGRVEIAAADLLVFRDYPALGVGPHQSKAFHAVTFRYASTHTEFTRMLAEHGTPGFVALLILGWMTWRRLSTSLPAETKAYAVGMTVWALLFMSHAAMRLVAPSFLFGLAAAQFLPAPAPGRPQGLLARPPARWNHLLTTVHH
jgi:hypothetical protein